MSFFKKGEYEAAKSLQDLTAMMVKVLPELRDATEARWEVMYSVKELDHIGGKCKRVTGTEKFHTGLDYNLLIHKGPFLASNKLDRLRILAHELYHIERDKKYFFVRFHYEANDGMDFCELPSHDKFSYRLAEKAAKELGIAI